MASLFPITFHGRISGNKFTSYRIGFCSAGSRICSGVFFTRKKGLVHFDDAEDLSCSLQDVQNWLADPQNQALRGGDQYLAMLKLEKELITRR